MNHRLSLLSIALLGTLLLTACDKEDMNKVFNANFYTSKTTGKLVLYVDNVEKGELSYFAIAPVCGQSYSDAARPVSMQLKTGEYQISGKNELGQITSYGTVRISEHKLATSGGIGGMSVTKSGDCVSIGLSE